jgi:putative transcriptional regulator
MSKISDSILRGAQEALEYAQGNRQGAKTHKVVLPDTVNVRAIREKLHMTRHEFADHFGFNIRTLEKWEQGVRRPESSARAYLIVINDSPKIVELALRRAQ